MMPTEFLVHLAEPLARVLTLGLAGLLWGASVYRRRGRATNRPRVAAATFALALIVAGAWAGLPFGPYLMLAGGALFALGITSETRLLLRALKIGG